MARPTRKAAGAHRVTAPAPFGVLVDGVAYGLTPYGGLIRSWERLLAGLQDAGVPIRFVPPERPRAPLPDLRPRVPVVARRWVFHSTYDTLAPPEADAVVHTVHDLIAESEDVEEPPRGVALATQESCVAGADVLVVPSRTVRAAVLERYGDGRPVRVAPHGVHPAFLAPTGAAARERTARLLDGHGVRRPFLLHVGGRERYKSFDLLLRAFLGSPLHRRLDLVVVGSQARPLADEHAALAGAPPEAVVRFLGRADDDVLAELYRRAAVLVAPSRAEGFGLPAVEAAACGTAVAHAAIPAFAETLGRDGFAFRPGDPDDLVRAVERALACAPARASATAQRIRGTYRWDVSVSVTIAAYREALEVAGDRGAAGRAEVGIPSGHPTPHAHAARCGATRPAPPSVSTQRSKRSSGSAAGRWRS